jgi:pimeloyl-ACP methyl ester carboxylesterase
VKDSQIILNGGRTLAYTDIGEPGWPTILFFHGAPTSRLHLAYLEEEFLARRVRVVSPDRPGYGRSSPLPGRSLVDWPADVEALAEALKIERFMAAGHSSGGPYAIVCAALLPLRVSALAVFGGVTDMGWRDAWVGFSKIESEAMLQPDEASGVAWCTEKFSADGSGFEAASDVVMTEPDTALLADERAGPILGSAMSEAFRQGVIGYAQDTLIQGRPWAFDVNAVATPARIIHGALDAVVPIAHSEHTAQLIFGSTLAILPGHGHLTTLAELPALILEQGA